MFEELVQSEDDRRVVLSIVILDCTVYYVNMLRKIELRELKHILLNLIDILCEKNCTIPQDFNSVYEKLVYVVSNVNHGTMIISLIDDKTCEYMINEKYECYDEIDFKKSTVDWYNSLGN